MEVNECYEALHGWLSAFYTYSSVSDQVHEALCLTPVKPFLES